MQKNLVMNVFVSKFVKKS